ncbi:hypothetical protein VB738_01615 [Cyanobium gracile UHCC 0139]|uniref:DUF6970 domain-containing protein n=1 Tax=Cyanobium gracile UHCC 0139 TaxID=3110308 RepID=A0ABU5RQB4_9CYAN|nr:hypothetical protein [Cyanobium gracile]MEA5389948.1 hypothetical protein [Cyanobium gracile UHCC 0139]
MASTADRRGPLRGAGLAATALAAATLMVTALTVIAPTALASPAAPLPSTLPAPPWLQRLIGQLKAQPPGNPPQSVWRYRYRGQVVYYLPPQCCDQTSVLFDAEGRVMGAPDGGLTGRGDGRAADFFAQRRQGLLLWRDPRGSAPP